MSTTSNSSSPYLSAAAGVVATALIGGAGTDVSSRWYRRLDKPRWQPPGPVFGVAWTLLYASIVGASGRALDIADDAERSAYRQALTINLILNADWPWVFFRAHRPQLALVEAVAVQISTDDLARRAWTLDRRAGLALTPYVAWTSFAVALTGSIARRNR